MPDNLLRALTGDTYDVFGMQVPYPRPSLSELAKMRDDRGRPAYDQFGAKVVYSPDLQDLGKMRDQQGRPMYDQFGARFVYPEPQPMEERSPMPAQIAASHMAQQPMMHPMVPANPPDWAQGPDMASLIAQWERQSRIGSTLARR